MRLRRLLFMCRYWLVRLLIRSARLLSICIFMVAIFFLFISAADAIEQWQQNGNLHDVAVSVYLQKFSVALPNSDIAIVQFAMDKLARLPTMLFSSLTAIASYVVKKLLDRAEDKLRRHKTLVADRNYLIQKIERKLS